MKATTKELIEGLELGMSHEKIQQIAREYMTSNGYKITPAGKQLAINELESYADEHLEANKLEVIALAGAIVTLEDV